jgi:hypothetical protein
MPATSRSAAMEKGSTKHRPHPAQQRMFDENPDRESAAQQTKDRKGMVRLWVTLDQRGWHGDGFRK